MFKNAVIKERLTLLITAVSAMAIIVTTIIMTAIGIYNMRTSLLAQLQDMALTTGEINVPYISFSQEDKAVSNLKSGFGIKPSILRVCMYSNGIPVATYFADSAEDKNCPDIHDPSNTADTYKDKVMTYQDKALVIKRLDDNGMQIISIALESDMRAIQSYLNKLIFTAIIIILVVVVVSYGLALAMQGTISVPLLALAETARRVSVEKDYSLRVGFEHDAGSKNEIFVLIDAFNNMLDEIQERDRRLLKQNEELGKAKKDAESANVAKSHFLANIGHELRTPLNAIIGFSSVFKEQLFGKLGNDKYMEYANDINDAGSHLLDIINDILDLSKAESGKMVLVFENVDIKACINKCINIMNKRATEGKVTITSTVPETLPYIFADRLRFSQIILNILSNAVKFTQPGGNVSISVESETRGGITTDFIIKVRDTGIGMAKESLAKVFQSFDQVESGLNRRYGGTGLGLPLTKNLVALHYGSISMESQVGVGTEVTLHFLANPTYISELLESDTLTP